jgi:hypothetical protein
MGVRGYLGLILKVFPSTIVNSVNCEYLIIDGNCVLHEAMQEFSNLDKFDNSTAAEYVVKQFELLLKNVKEKHIIICFDGIPPKPKQICQQRRRNGDTSFGAILLPNTKLMSTIENLLISKFASSYISFDLSTNRGEGEQKMIKHAKTISDSTINLMTLDSDVIILSQLSRQKNIFVTIMKGYYPMTIISIDKLVDLFDRKKLSSRLLFFCCLCGNDFFPQFTDYQDTSAKQLCTLFLTNLNLTDFYFLAESKCTRKCKMTNVVAYTNLWRWYQQYFTTNKNYACEPYLSTKTPCSFCIIKYLEMSSAPELKYDDTTPEEHLKYVLSSFWHNKLNEITL